MSEAKDTVGWHLERAMTCARVAEVCNRRASTVHSEARKNQDLRIAAEHYGAAAGHAFRAAELAHDATSTGAYRQGARCMQRRAVQVASASADETPNIPEPDFCPWCAPAQDEHPWPSKPARCTRPLEHRSRAAARAREIEAAICALPVEEEFL